MPIIAKIEHSTKQHKKFLPEDEPNSINAYDNTVVKTDDYLSKIIGKLRSNYPDSWVFYSSDHGRCVVLAYID
jgi:glucan phosphoethanolaminetransferase (alkaline phosphatase superfamily)